MLHSSGSGGRSAWASNDDYLAISGLIIVVGLGFGGYELWINYHAEISWSVLSYAHWQIFHIGKFTDAYVQQDAFIQAAHPDQATLPQLWALLNSVGCALRVPAITLMLVLAVACYFGATTARFCRQFDLAGLRKEQARFFRSASAMMGRQLSLVGIRSGDPRPADPALLPSEWIKRYANRPDGSLDETAAARALARQLGPKWTGFAEAAPHVRFLFAAFALHLAGRREEAFLLLGDLAEKLPRDGKDGKNGPAKPLRFPTVLSDEADRFLEDAALYAPVRALAQKHAYTSTALMSVLNEARRRSGVLPPATFNAIKLVDRPLWYALHSLGFPGDGPGQNSHPNPRIEALGSRDHWASERMVKMPLVTPSVGQALASIKAASAGPSESWPA